MTFEPFDAAKFWREHNEAWARKIEKLATFEPGDRVTKMYFKGLWPNMEESVMTGIFVEAVPPIDCKVKWDNEDEVEEDCPVSMISHA